MKVITTTSHKSLTSIVFWLFILFTSAQVQSRSLDFDFDPNITGASATVSAMALQDDGKIVVTGFFDSVGGVVRDNIARLEPNGDVDPSFRVTLNDRARAVAIQPDGKVIVAGTFTRVEEVGGNAESYIRSGIVRLESDGTVDPDFNPNVNSLINTIFIQDDGKIIIGGAFTRVGGVSRSNLARLNEDGSLDTSFSDPRISGGAGIFKVVMQDDGQLIVAGSFTRVGRLSRSRVARLNGADGSLDLSFANPRVNNFVNALAIQEDGGIIIGGHFTAIGQFARNYIARIETDGSLDTEFNRSLRDVSGWVSDIALQADGKIFIGGRFDGLVDQNKVHLARLQQDGDIDIDFNPAVYNQVSVLSLLIQQDNKLLVGGRFAEVNGFSRNNMARFNPDRVVDGASGNFIPAMMLLLLE